MREEFAMEAALQRGTPADAREMVNLLAGLDEYEVVGGIQSDKDLGLYYLEENDTRLLELREYVNLEELGRTYANLHHGLFVGGCYVVYPEREQPEVYDGIALPEPDYSWSLRLKLASSVVPDGVWLALPDYNDIMDVRPGEIRLALDALGVQTIRGCTLLEARCSLPGITGLEDAYAGRLEDLIYDGQNLGFILQEQNQGQKDFLQTYLWALEHEDCTTLPAALEIAQHLNRYHVVYTDQLQDVAKAELRSAGRHQLRHPSPSRRNRPETSAATSLFRDLLIPLRYNRPRSEEHTSELQSPILISYAVFCLKKKKFF